MRNKTFIINLFDVKDSVKCFDTIVTEVEPKLKLTLEKHKVSYYIKLCQKKLAQASTSSSSHDTDEVRYFLLRINVIILYMQLNI